MELYLIDRNTEMSTQATAAGGGGSIKRSAAQWSDISDDLLYAIRSRIASPRDLVRCAAVCKPWRAAASRRPVRPTTPLLLVFPWMHRGTKHLCGPVDGWAVRIPDKVAGMRFVGSYDGGWVAALDDRDKLVIMNLFSGAEVVLSEEQSMFTSIRSPSGTGTSSFHVSKISFSGDPTSSNGCILAAIVKDYSHIALCRVGCQGWWTTHCRDDGELIGDIAFCNGELYGLTPSNKLLIKFVTSMEPDGKLAVTAIQSCGGPPSPWKDDAWTYVYSSHIVELHGKPPMAVRGRWFPELDPFFKVFKLVDAGTNGTYKQKWTELTCFGDHALFLGIFCSKAVHVPMNVEHHGLKRNHIYYHEYNSRESKLPQDASWLYSVTSNDDGHIHMYCKKDQSIGDGLERTGYYVMGMNESIWLHPPHL